MYIELMDLPQKKSPKHLASHKPRHNAKSGEHQVRVMCGKGNRGVLSRRHYLPLLCCHCLCTFQEYNDNFLR
jgi:hypothetical protein